MKKIYQIPGLLLVLAGVLSGCEAPSPEPSSALDEIAKSYQKTETSASQEEVDELIRLDRQHFEEYISRYRSAKDVSGAGFDVGVVPAVDNCPLWSEKITIFVDNENDSPATSMSGWVGAWTKTGNGDAYMKFCKVDGRLFTNMRGTFGVLKLGANNPVGFKRVRTLLMDNQDNGSTSITSGAAEAQPNYVDGNKNLRLLFTEFEKVNNGLPPTPYPDFGFSYGVFGRPEVKIEFGLYYTDDEDDDCATSESFVDPYDSSNISFRIDNIQNPGPFQWRTEARGTYFHHAKVK